MKYTAKNTEIRHLNGNNFGRGFVFGSVYGMWNC